MVALGVALVCRLLAVAAAPYPLKAAALCIAAILATPYSLDYDMMVLAPAIAFLAADGLAHGVPAASRSPRSRDFGWCRWSPAASPNGHSSRSACR